MAECIEREAVFSAIWKTSAEHDVFFPAIILDAIKSIPAADVQPVRRGKWIIVDQGDTACLVECDQCGMHYIVANDVFDEWLASDNRNYCPKCGAYMREKNGEEI